MTKKQIKEDDLQKEQILGEKEAQKMGLCYVPADDPAGIILGANEEGDKALCAICSPGNKQNIAVYGSTGTGKTRHVILPSILANIMRKMSFIAADPSGELFRSTAKLAEENGMEVKVLNLSDLNASDGWDCFAEIKKQWNAGSRHEAECGIDVLARTIINNTGGDYVIADSYYTAAETNLLMFLMRYVAISPYFAGEEYERNLGTCYDILIELIKNNGRLPIFEKTADKTDDPAKLSWKIFTQSNQKQKEAVMAGLEERLRMLNNETLKQVLSEDEIDLAMPEEKPCAYYVINSIMSRSMTPLAELFFTELITSLMSEVDKNQGRPKTLVALMLDEFTSIGQINDLASKMMLFRRYGISMVMAFQHPDQIRGVYPETHMTILDNCGTHLLTYYQGRGVDKLLSRHSGMPAEDIRCLYQRNPEAYILSEANEGVAALRPYPIESHCLYAKINRNDIQKHVPEWKNKEEAPDRESTFRGMTERIKEEALAKKDYDVKTFRELLRKCIGDASQASFAEKCGMSKENLNRLLNSSDPSKPSKSTLQKIADNSNNVISIKELLTACRYDTERHEEKQMPFVERAAENARQIFSGIKELIKSPATYPSVYEFLDIYKTLYSKENERYYIIEEEEHHGSNHQGAENYALVKSLFDDNVKDGDHFFHKYCETWFVIYYSETKKGQVIISDIATDKESVTETIGDDDFWRTIRRDELVDDPGYLYRTMSKAIRNDSDEHILKRDSDDKYIDITTHGFGFYLKKIPDNIMEFYKKHRDPDFDDDTDNDGEGFTPYPEEMKDDGMHDYTGGFGPMKPGRYEAPDADPISGFEGYGVGIAGIMRRETDLRFSWWPADTGTDAENTPCIMVQGFDDDYPFEDEYEDIYYAAEKYARELGIDKIGTCITHYPKRIKEYDVKPLEEDNR